MLSVCYDDLWVFLTQNVEFTGTNIHAFDIFAYTVLLNDSSAT